MSTLVGFERTNFARDQVEALHRLRAGEDDSLGKRAKEAFEAFFPTCPTDTSVRLTHFVLQGGGTLGIAHLGFLYGLEQVGVRFVGAAGTSAGAIVSLVLAAARTGSIGNPISLALLPILASIPAAAFIDGPYLARRFIKYALAKRYTNRTEFLLPAVVSFTRILREYGLNRGHYFESWLAQTLSREFRVNSLVDLRERLMQVAIALDPSLASKDKAAVTNELLHVVATAMPLGLKIVFPKDLIYFEDQYSAHSPAVMARASMSVPLFFEPLEMTLMASQWTRWVDEHMDGVYDDRVCEGASRLRALAFIDGGLLSNFPIDAFASFGCPGSAFERVTSAPLASMIPTVGVALVSNTADLGRVKRARGTIGGLGQYVGNVVNAMRHQRDREALTQAHRLGRTKVAFVNTGNHHWLNFMLSREDMRDLFERGLVSCNQFLRTLADGGPTT